MVYDDKITTEDSNSTPETANRKLTMGVKLRIADRKDWAGRISNRSAYNNYVVWMPVRNDDGSFRNQLALISEHCMVSEGFLPLTIKNLAIVMFNQLGNTYGWGGMLGSQDCSGYIRDVYRCFGLEMGRNSNNQAVQPVRKFNLQGKTNEEKAAIIKELPLGSELIFSGHTMLYLGHEEDKLYVISSTSSMVVNGEFTRVRSAVISTLDVERSGNRGNWLTNLHTATIPYYNAKAKDISNATIKGLDDTYYYNGSPITPSPEVIVDGETLKENRHYTVSYADNTEVGTAKIIINGKGKYEGSANANFNIKVSNISDATVESISDRVYTGNAKKPKPKVTLGGKELVLKTDYTLSYTENVNVGKAFVTITGKGIHIGSKTVSFNIIPEGTTVSKLNKRKRAFIIKWKLQSTKMSTANITGYEIQYARNSKFTKSMKKVKVKNYTTTSKKIKNLKKKKKYYVRIRTYMNVGGVTYYSKWSKTKSVKTK